MKRLFDVVAATLLVILVSPLMLTVAIVVWLTMGSPILFRQPRAGQHGRPFELLKFRTMLEKYDAVGNPLADGERLTRVGRLLRASSLDELPELWNVIRGEMSLVGPRPLLLEYLPLYSATQARRHEVKPGITGWAQVNGRNAISWEQKMAYDGWYVDHQSILLDIKILVLTLIKVLARHGINESGVATATKFRGCGDHAQ